jgi:hypothetical protein
LTVVRHYQKPQQRQVAEANCKALRLRSGVRGGLIVTKAGRRGELWRAINMLYGTKTLDPSQ